VKRFYLNRKVDETGISGTGIVAEGVQFEDGTAALRWFGKTASTGIYRSIADVLIVHGHGGKTQVVWLDE